MDREKRGSTASTSSSSSCLQGAAKKTLLHVQLVLCISLIGSAIFLGYSGYSALNNNKSPNSEIRSRTDVPPSSTDEAASVEDKTSMLFYQLEDQQIPIILKIPNTRPNIQNATTLSAIPTTTSPYSTRKGLFPRYEPTGPIQEYMDQNPLVKLLLDTVTKPAILEALVAVAVHALGIPVITACASWLGPYGTAGWTMRHRYTGFARLLAKASSGTANGSTRSSSLGATALISKGWKHVCSIVNKSRSSAAATATANSNQLAKIWNASRRAIRHVYKKRARYSVASELTNFVPPEPKHNNHNNNGEDDY